MKSYFGAKKIWGFHLICLFSCSILLSCATFLSPKNNDEIVGGYENQRNDVSVKSENLNTQVKVKENKIFCWWWIDSDVQKGINADNPPFKKRYLEIEKWEYDGEGKKTYPKEVDFLSQISNESFTEFQGIIKFQLSARFEDYEKLYFRNQQDDSINFREDNFEKLTWINEEVILEEKIIIEANRERTTERKAYDLTNLLNRKENGKPICALRFIVQVFDTAGNKITSKEKVMHILLGD